MVGKGKLAIQELNAKIASLPKQKQMFLSRVAAIPAFVHMLSGDLKRTNKAALELRIVAKKSGFSYADSIGEYMQAGCYFNAYDLDNALQHFSSAAERKYITHTVISLCYWGGLALTYQGLGRAKEADETMMELLEFAQQTDDVENIILAESFRARLSLLQGHLDTAINWQQSFSAPFHPSSFFIWLEFPHITQCRVLISSGADDSLHEAIDMLERLLKTANEIHNTFHMIDILALQALAFFKLSRVDEALNVLKQAIDLAMPGGWIRPFVEPGFPMPDLLNRFIEQGFAVDYIGKILSVFRSDQKRVAHDLSDHRVVPSPSLQSSPVIESLTKRELDILIHLAEGLSNKEIASKLFLSPLTVKKHLYNIFQKMDVRTRLSAVNKAKELGIFPHA
jgi:LuxR family maltose regulon positive regulatory protein